MEFLDTDFLENEEIKLFLQDTRVANPEKGYVPAYVFYICDLEGNILGACDLRIGHNESTFYGGNIGYQVREEYRGNHYAAKAAKLLFDLARKHNMEYLYISCNPDNLASRKTCERLEGEFIGIFDLPEDNAMRTLMGETQKCIYKYRL